MRKSAAAVVLLMTICNAHADGVAATVPAPSGRLARYKAATVNLVEAEGWAEIARHCGLRSNTWFTAVDGTILHTGERIALNLYGKIDGMKTPGGRALRWFALSLNGADRIGMHSPASACLSVQENGWLVQLDQMAD